MAHDPGHIELHDPETDPLATYVLEPDDIRTLLRRVVASPGSSAQTTAPTAARMARRLLLRQRVGFGFAVGVGAG